MHLDSYTLLVVNFATCTVNAFGIATIWIQNRTSYDGMFLWLCSIAIQIIGLTLILLHGVVPDFLSVVFSNVIMAFGAIALLVGLERFVNIKGPRAHYPVLLAAYAGFMSCFTDLHADMEARLVVMAVMMTIIASQAVWLLLYKVDRDMRKATYIVGIAMSAHILLNLVRITFYLFNLTSSNDAFRAGAADAITTLMYTALNVFLTISLILMVNRRLLQDVQGQEEKFSNAFHSAPYAVILASAASGEIILINDSFARMTGYTPAEMLGRKTLELHLFQNDEVRECMMEALSHGSAAKSREVRFKVKSGELMTGLFNADTIRIHNKECILMSIGDITELSDIKSKLEIMATHDALTGLPNRTLFYDRFNQALAHAQRHGCMLAIISIDLDKFKCINDKLGHHAGDAVLLETAKRLTSVLRRSDTVSRFGGDEFVLLLGEIASKQHAGQAVAKIVSTLQEPFVMEGRILSICASVGVSLFPNDGCNIEELLRKSDKALYCVKRNGRNGFLFFSDADKISSTIFGQN
jgi:diguanylate cyclase (GGDEF)-like protein/PAS domain S-box-containing protein